jgi:hypothetical protein
MRAPNLSLAAARFALDLASSEELVKLADDLLASGVYSYSLGELYSIRYPNLSDVCPLFTSSLKELGVPLPSREEAARTLVKGSISDIAEGNVTPLGGLTHLLETISAVRLYQSGVVIQPNLDLCGSGEVSHWVSEYEYMTTLVDEGYIGADESEQRLAALNSQVTAFADRWLGEHAPLPIDPSWLTWNEATVRKLAQAIRDERRFGDLPILADALEEAGCTSPDVLAHCRDPGNHSRRCWLVDRLLS